MKQSFLHFFILFLPIVIWQVVVSREIVSNLLLPSPMSVFGAFVMFFRDSIVITDIGMTLYRVFVSLLVGVLLGSLIGLVISVSKTLKGTFMLWVDFLRSIPAPTLIPIFLLLFGLGDLMKITITVFVVSLIMVIVVVVGARNINQTRINVGKIMGFNKLMLLRRVVIPEMLPHVSSGVRLAISFSLILVIVSEMLVSTEAGIGKRIVEFQLLFETSSMYALVLFTGIIGYLSNRFYRLFENRYIHWAGK